MLFGGCGRQRAGNWEREAMTPSCPRWPSVRHWAEWVLHGHSGRSDARLQFSPGPRATNKGVFSPKKERAKNADAGGCAAELRRLPDQQTF